MLTKLPIFEVLDELVEKLVSDKRAVLSAPPGAGKSTAIPISLTKNPAFSNGKIIVLEPRRLAVKQVASRMAQTLGEPLGKTVGYRIRGESKCDEQTKVEVVTEGILIRMIQEDQQLTGISTVIFDEFHERSLNADLGLAFCLEIASVLREDLKILVETARISMIAERSSHDEIRREGENRNRRIIEITQELNNWRQRLITAEERINDLIIRKKECEAELKNAKNAPEDIHHKSELLLKEMGIAEKKCEEATNILTNSETELREIEVTERKSERFASDAREARARAEAISEGAQTTLDAAYSRITEELDSTPQDLLEKLNIDPRNLPEAEKVDNDVQRLKRQRDALGAVNLRAEEDSNEVKKEFETLDSESSDLKEAIGKLRDGISSLNSEGRERLLSAFDEVNKNFGVLFKHLFGGGEASLMLVESDDPLEAGLEIMCQPPGKKLSTLSLLSGGEQTLTALSLIFAVFLANPSPICVLDEVDAPLDDANVTRFCDLLDEMTKRTDTRFLIITHHAVTMARMDRLFGVTMAEPGVSQLVSVDLKNAEKLVA